MILLPDGETIGQRVARCRKAKGLSQEVLAHLLGKSHSWLTKVERGVRQLDRMSLILEIACVLKVDATEIAGRPVLTTPPPEELGVRPAPPLALLRLRSATAAYLAILRTTLPAVETMAAYADSPELLLTPDVATPTQDLAEAVRAALEVDDAPGTPAAIERLVGAALDDAAYEARLDVTSIPWGGSGGRAPARSPLNPPA